MKQQFKDKPSFLLAIGKILATCQDVYIEKYSGAIYLVDTSSTSRTVGLWAINSGWIDFDYKEDTSTSALIEHYILSQISKHCVIDDPIFEMRKETIEGLLP